MDELIKTLEKTDQVRQQLVRTLTPIEGHPSLAWTQDEVVNPEEVPTGGTAYVIDSEGAANWYLKKLTLWEAEKAILKAQYEQRVAEIDADKKRLEHLYQGQLEAWAREEAERRRRKTVTMPMGTISFRTVPAHVKVIDAEAALAFLETFPAESIHRNLIIPQPAKIDTKGYAALAEDHLNENGSLPGGCDYVPERENVSIKTAKAKEGVEG
jgi:hypothetical protein